MLQIYHRLTEADEWRLVVQHPAFFDRASAWEWIETNRRDGYYMVKGELK